MSTPPPCESACDAPPCKCVDAISFAAWQAKLGADVRDWLFARLPAGTSTFTRVVNYQADNKARHAYGMQILGFKSDGTPIPIGTYYFHISFSEGAPGTNEIAQLASTHSTWASTRSAGSHTFRTEVLAAASTPPKCGTPYTPSCPPDPLLGGAVAYLRDLLAGPGANPTRIADAAGLVDELLLETLQVEIEKRVTGPAVPPGLRGATSYLRDLYYQDALRAGQPADAVTIERAGLEVERTLLAAIEAQVLRFPRS